MLIGVAPSANAAFSNTPDATWMTNGQVYSIVQSGNTVYLGGKFKALRQCPPGQRCGPGSAISSGLLNLGALDATTGVAIKNFKHEVGAPGEKAFVYALAVLDGKLFIGGKFSEVDGQPRLNLAAIDLATNTLDPDVAPQIGVDISDRIRGMIAHNDRIYVAGYFGTVNGQPRKKLAAFDSDGNLDPVWKPRTSGLSRTLTTTCDGSSIIAGGAFRKAAGSTGTNQDRATLAMFDATSGELKAWTPDNAEVTNGVNAFDLDRDCSTNRLMVGYGGSNAIYAFDLGDNFGDILWSLKTGGNVQTVAVGGDRVYFGGHFANVPVACPGVTGNVKDKRVRFAVANLDGCIRESGSTAPIDGFAPEFSGKFYGPWDIYANSTQLWVGGHFTDVSGTAQYMIARFTDA
jgi:hypothetical protein